MHSTLVNLWCEVTLWPFFIRSISWSVRVCCCSHFQGQFLNFKKGGGLLLRKGGMGKKTQIMVLYKNKLYMNKSHVLFSVINIKYSNFLFIPPNSLQCVSSVVILHLWGDLFIFFVAVFLALLCCSDNFCDGLTVVLLHLFGVVSCLFHCRLWSLGFFFFGESLWSFCVSLR